MKKYQIVKNLAHADNYIESLIRTYKTYSYWYLTDHSTTVFELSLINANDTNHNIAISLVGLFPNW